MDERIKYLLNGIKSLGYSVQHEDGNTYTIGKNSPCGQDCYASIDTENDAELFLENIREYADDFDVSYEAYLWLDNSGHGVNGAPYDMKDVYEDMEWWRDSLIELEDDLQNMLYGLED